MNRRSLFAGLAAAAALPLLGKSALAYAEPLLSNSLIVDGTIITEKIAAGAITGTRISAGLITAGSISVEALRTGWILPSEVYESLLEVSGNIDTITAEE